MRVIYIITIAIASLAACVDVHAQSRGTFSGSAVSGLGTGGSTPDKENPILTKDTIDAWLQQHMRDISSRLKAAKKGSINPNARNVVWIEKSKRYQFHSRADQEAEVKRLEAEINSPILPPLNPFHLKTGQIGTLGDLPTGHMPYSVLQIVQPDTAIIEASTNMYATFRLTGKVVESLQEDQKMRTVPGIFIVEGKKQFSTIASNRTLPVLRDYDMQPHLAKSSKKAD